MTLGEKIKEIRTQKNLTQAKFAKLLQISQGMLSLLEQGKHEPPFSFFQTLINDLKVNPYFLFSDDKIIFDNEKLLNREILNQALKDIDKAIYNLNQISL